MFLIEVPKSPLDAMCKLGSYSVQSVVANMRLKRSKVRSPHGLVTLMTQIYLSRIKCCVAIQCSKELALAARRFRVWSLLLERKTMRLEEVETSSCAKSLLLSELVAWHAAVSRGTMAEL